jgi:capsular exopolysaccharide synthesis family protein
MWILPAGPLPPNPTEFLNSDKCASVINECADLYDFVILDSPPTVGISDMQVISRMVDAVIIVVGSDRATRSGLEITYRTLYQVRAHVLGMVINRVEISRHGYGYYGYYNYYSYYAQEYGVEADGKGTKKRKRRKKKKES